MDALPLIFGRIRQRIGDEKVRSPRSSNTKFASFFPLFLYRFEHVDDETLQFRRELFVVCMAVSEPVGHMHNLFAHVSNAESGKGVTVFVAKSVLRVGDALINMRKRCMPFDP